MYSHSKALLQCRRFRVFSIWFISLLLVGSMPLAAHADNEKVMAVMSRQAEEVGRLAANLAKMEAFSTSQTQDMAALRERHAQERDALDAEVVRLEGVESTLREEIEALKAALLEAQQMQKRFTEEKEELAAAGAKKQQDAVSRAQEEAREEVKRRLEEQRAQAETRHSKVLAEKEAAWQRESDEQRDTLRRSLEKEHAEALRQQKERLENEMRALGEDIERQLKEVHGSRAAAERARAADGRAHAKEKEALDAELAQRRQEAQEAREETGRVRAALEKEAAENLQQELAALRAAHTVEMERLKEEHRAAMSVALEKERARVQAEEEEKSQRALLERIRSLTAEKEVEKEKVLLAAERMHQDALSHAVEEAARQVREEQVQLYREELAQVEATHRRALEGEAERHRADLRKQAALQQAAMVQQLAQIETRLREEEAAKQQKALEVQAKALAAEKEEALMALRRDHDLALAQKVEEVARHVRAEAEASQEEMMAKLRSVLEEEAATILQQERAALHKEHAAEVAHLRTEQTRLLEEQRQHLKAVAEEEKRQASRRLEEEKERSVAEAIAHTQAQVSEEARVQAQAAQDRALSEQREIYEKRLAAQQQAQEEARLRAVEEAVSHARDEVRAQVEAEGRHAQDRALAEMQADYEARLDAQQREWAVEKQQWLEERRAMNTELEAALARVRALEAAQTEQERGHVQKMDALRAKVGEYEAERVENEKEKAVHLAAFRAQGAEIDRLKDNVAELEEDARLFTRAFAKWEAQHSRTSLAKVVASFELLLAGEGVEDAHRRATILDRFFGAALAKQAVRDEEPVVRRSASSMRTPSHRGATERETLEVFDGDSDVSEPSSTSVRVGRGARRDRESLTYLDVTVDGSPLSHQAAPASPAPFSRSRVTGAAQRGAALDDASLLSQQPPRAPSRPDAETTLPLTRRHLALLDRGQPLDAEEARSAQHMRERDGVERRSGSFALSSHDHVEASDQAALDQARLKFEQQRVALQQLEAELASDGSSSTSSDEEGTPPRRSARSHVSSMSEGSHVEGASIRGGRPRVRRGGDALADADD